MLYLFRKGAVLHFCLKCLLCLPGKSDLHEVLESRRIDFAEIHTSGHAYVEDLRQLADALKPRATIPIHTFSPGEFPKLFPNVVLLQDGEEFVVPDKE